MMNSLYIIGFLCLVALSMANDEQGGGPDEHNGTHPYGGGHGHAYGHAYGKHGGNGFDNFDFKACFDFKKYIAEAAQAPGCENITKEFDGPPAGPGGKQGGGKHEHGSHEHKHGHGHGGHGHKHGHGHHGHGHGGRLMKLTSCFNARFEVMGPNNETIVANVIKAIDTVAQPEKSQILIDTFNQCANMTETLAKEESLKAMECYGKVLLKECPRSARTEATTQATA